jgi:O-antigen/teichoic acid export membrane protein
MKSITGNLLVKNIGLNYIGQAVLFVVFIFTVPYVVKGLGPDRYGIYAILWTLIGYFTFLELGIGRATTKFVASALGNGKTEEIPRIVLTVFLIMLGLGIIGTIIFFFITPYLVDSIFKVPDLLKEEMKSMFIMASPYIIMLLLQIQLRGVLEAYQRFDLINFIKIPSQIFTLVIPVIIVALNGTLPMLALALVTKEFVFCLIYMTFCIKVMPPLKVSNLLTLEGLKTIASYAGWLSIAQIISALLLHNLQPFLIGLILSTTIVTFYSVPYDLVLKLLVIPNNIIVVLFPAFSTLEAASLDKLGKTFKSALKYLTILILPVSFIGIFFTEEIITLWLGKDFEMSINILRIMMIGFFIMSIEGIFVALLLAVGRVKEISLFVLFIAPVYIIISVTFIKNIGVIGAAFSWLILRIISFAFSGGLSWKLGLIKWDVQIKGILKPLAGLSFFTICVVIFKSAFQSSWITIITAGAFLIISYLFVIWHYFIDGTEKKGIVNIIKSISYRNM